MGKLLDWLDHRTGYRKLRDALLLEHIPGGARWRYVWGSTLMFALAVQFITGIFLWMAYAPSSQTAWESVYYIQDQMRGGWLLRGLHHYTAQVIYTVRIWYIRMPGLPLSHLFCAAMVKADIGDCIYNIFAVQL